MSATTRLFNSASPLSKQWQFPLLLLAVALFASGIIRVLPRSVAPSFDEQIREARELLGRSRFTEAHDKVAACLIARGRTNEERRDLHRLMAETIYTAERSSGPPGLHRAENADRVIAHLRTAERMKASLDAPDWLRMADALSWSGRWSEAVEALRRAIAAGTHEAGATRRRLIEWLVASEPRNPAVVEQELDALLAEPAAAPADLHWALQQRVDGLLESGHPDTATALLERLTPRLAGSPQKFEIAYERGRCLLAAGCAVEAARVLRELRDAWSPHDDLWARTGLLLAKIEQDDGRPESALSFYDDVQTVFKSGPRHMECLMGRAQSLVELERYDEARGVYAELVELAGKGPTRDVLRAGLTALAANLNARQRPADGVAFLHMARALAADGTPEQQAAYASEEAELSESLAQRAAAEEKETPDGPARDTARRRKIEMHRRAGEALVQLAGLRRGDESVSVDTLWRAVDAFEAAGESNRSARLLEGLIAERPKSTRRVAAMLRLARLRQSDRAYREAVAIYERILHEYPRTQDALQSLVPLATCLLALGGESTARAEKVLVKILDEAPDSEPLFDPRAPEYGDALFKLGELYCEQVRNEEAITRLEAFLALYPEDARDGAVRFMLADAYHRSGSALMSDREKTSDVDARAKIEREARRRVARAAGLFARVIADDSAGPGAPGLTPTAAASVPRTRLTCAWLHRGDCLFDLGDYAAARDVYAEAAWRFDNDLTAVTASMQLVHCHRRLGATREGRAALERLRWLVRKMPEAAFTQRPGAADRGYWLAAVDRMIDAGIH